MNTSLTWKVNITGIIMAEHWIFTYSFESPHFRVISYKGWLEVEFPIMTCVFLYLCHFIFWKSSVIFMCAKPCESQSFFKNLISSFWRHVICHLWQWKGLFLPQRKFWSINTISQSLVSVKTCSCELLAAKLSTLYILDNWGCCKYSVVQ